MLKIAGDTATVRRSVWNGPAMKPGEPVDTLDARRNALRPVHDSKLEASYELYLSALKHVGEIQAFWYHPLTLKLPGGVRYTPDFMVWPNEGKVQIHECKGWSKNLRDGMTRLKLASGLFSCWDWRLVKRNKGQWDISAV